MQIFHLFYSSLFCLHGCVGTCAHLYVRIQLCVRVWARDPSVLTPFLSHYSDFFFFKKKQDFSLNLELTDSARLAAQWCLGILFSVPSATEPQIPNLGITLTLHLAFHVGSENVHSGLLVQIANTHKESVVNTELPVLGPKPQPHRPLLFCLIAFCDLPACV